MTNTEELRAVSDKIWNTGMRITHNQLDEILAHFAAQIEKAKVEEVVELLRSEVRTREAELESSPVSNSFIAGWYRAIATLQSKFPTQPDDE